MKRIKGWMIGLCMVCAVMVGMQATDQKVHAEGLTVKEVWAKSGDTSWELQKLLNINNYGGYQLTVHIPAGNYELTRELLLYSNTTILADKQAVFSKNHQKGAMLTNDLVGDKGGYETAKNITIDGGVWDSAKIATLGKGTESFRFIHATNITVKNATICNISDKSHLVTFAGVKNGVLENCVLYGYEGATEKEAVHLDIVHDTDMVPAIQQNRIVYDDLPCDTIRISGCEIYDYPRAVGAHISVKGVYHKNILIENNYFHDLKESAIKAYNYENLTISGNRIERVGLGILVYTYLEEQNQHYIDPLPTTVQEPVPATYNVRIDGNTITDIFVVKTGSVTKWGDGIRVIGNAERPMKGITISDNTIERVKRYGIYLTAAPGHVIAGNKIRVSERHGIYVDERSDKGTIDSNVLNQTGSVKSAAGGIGICDTRAEKITGNTVSNAGKYGIFAYSGSSDAVIKSNVVKASGDTGIYLSLKSNNPVIAKNVISGRKSSATNRGIYVYACTGSSIQGNTITGCAIPQRVSNP